MDTITDMETGAGPLASINERGLLRLVTWLSPSFPVGAFSYSHGIEYAVETERVTDRATMVRWMGALLAHGSACVDATLFRAAYAAVRDRDEELVEWTIERGDAMRATREFGVESEGQGGAFLQSVRGAWPEPSLDWLHETAIRLQRPVVYPVAVGGAAAAHGLPERQCLSAYLHAFAANLVSAGVRLIPLGQSDGLRALAALEPEILAAVEVAMKRTRDDIGSATVVSDWSSASHETQYTRLFRS